MVGHSGPIRVLYVNHARIIGGAENSLMSLLRHLDPERVVADIAMPGPGPLNDALLRLPVQAHEVPIPRPYYTCNPLRVAEQVMRLWRARRHLGRLARSVQADIIHGNNVPSGIACAIGGPPLPFVCHVRDALVRPQALRWLMPRCNRVIAISHTVANRIRHAWGEPSHLTVIYNGIDEDDFAVKRSREQVRDELDTPTDAPVVAIVSRIVPWKRHDVFIEASRIISRSYPNCRFWVLGDDLTHNHRDYLAHLKQIASPNVSFLGQRDDVADIMAAADLIAHAATKEALGRVVLEAMLVGTPVVAANAGGPSELIEHERSGLLVEPASAEALAAGLLRLLDNPHEARRYAEAGRVRVQQFSADAMAQSIMAVYEDLLGMNNARGD